MHATTTNLLICSLTHVAACTHCQVAENAQLSDALDELQKVFELTRTNRLFKLYDAVSDAVAEIGSHGAGLSANLGK